MDTGNGHAIKPYANLRGANLRGANLREANLRGVRDVAFASFDARGYVLVCWLLEGAARFTAGCHRGLTLDEAVAHWGSKEYPDQERGQSYVSACKFLAEVINKERDA